ncbi:hypothetical protein [Streptomyces sp. B6B3]|uniref:hypothetical protein n=1 Tax=Streptomyces sp. B6B3 TaxID=3153570 RepID=UPI00325C5513
MASGDGIRLSVVVMHHPKRRDALPALLAACEPLPVRVVTDPDPDGPPSPLRTAKRAWAAVAEGATHHVVLQDDAVPVRGFADQLTRAIAARPHDGVTLSVQQTSPRNSYAVRRAALAGQAWAPMSVVEWTSTLGLALPAADALALAAYFAELPDELLEDDDFVTPFCVGRGRRVFATVPNLVEHAGLPSLSGYEAEGHRPVTVYDPRWSIPAGHWADPARRPAPGLAEAGRGGAAVELRESRCGLRFLLPGTEEPLEHPYVWDWHDWAALLDLDADRVVAEWERAGGAAARRGEPVGRVFALAPCLSLEVWAAAFLLGALLPAPTAAGPPGDTGFGELVRRRALESWIEMGLSAADRKALTPEEVTALVDLALAGATAGRGTRDGNRNAVPNEVPNGERSPETGREAAHAG